MESDLSSNNQQTFSSKCMADLKEKIGQLNAEKPFFNFTLGLSEEEKTTLRQISIDGTKEYNNFDNLDQFESKTTAFLQSLGNSEELSLRASKIIKKVVNDIKAAFNVDAAWVAIRSFTETTEFDEPRLHTDGYYYLPFEGSQYKVAIALKGAGTLFYELPEDFRNIFKEIQNKQTLDNEKENRAKFVKLLEEYSTQTQCFTYPGETCSGVVFLVGNSDFAAVHSEPPIHSQRLFLSILPGSKKQIQELHDRWGQK